MLQTVVDVVVKSGLGLTTTVTCWGVLLQLLAVVIILYVTVIGLGVVFVRVSLIGTMPLADALGTGVIPVIAVRVQV